MNKAIKKDALKLIKKQVNNNKISIIDIWDIELKLEKKYPSIGENQIINIVEDVLIKGGL